MIAAPEQRRRSMSTQARRRNEEQRVSGWAIGGLDVWVIWALTRPGAIRT
jgi:hypothetical protein